MTCIVGLKDKENKCVWMGADSLGSNSWYKTVISDEKLFKYEEREDTIIGSCGSCRHGDLLKYDTTLFDEIDKYKNVEITHKYMVTKFIPNLHKLLKNSCGTDGGIESPNFLIAIADELFQIQENYSILRLDDGFASVGSGAFHAIGSLFTTEGTNMSKKKRIIKALEAAEHSACGVQRPFVIMNTLGERFVVK